MRDKTQSEDAKCPKKVLGTFFNGAPIRVFPVQPHFQKRAKLG